MQRMAGIKLINGWFKRENMAVFFYPSKTIKAYFIQGGTIEETKQHVYAIEVIYDDCSLDVIQAFDTEQEAEESLKWIQHLIFGKIVR